MFFKFILPVFLLSYSASAAQQYSLNLEPIVAQQLEALHVMMGHFTRTQADTADSNRISNVDVNKCFNSYITQQDTVVNKYNTNYNGCISTADAAKAGISEESSQQRSDIEGRGNSVCSALTGCESLVDGLQFFQCYNAASSENYPILYNISTETKLIAEKIKIEYQTIENNLKICTTNAQNSYVIEMAACNTDLNNCLNGVPPETTVTTNTPDTTTDVTTTTPETTSVDSTTEQTIPPVSTEASPEEDLLKYRPMSRMNMWNVLRRL